MQNLSLSLTICIYMYMCIHTQTHTQFDWRVKSNFGVKYTPAELVYKTKSGHTSK